MYQYFVPFYGWKTYSTAFYLFISWWKLGFHLLGEAMINIAAVNICVQGFMWTSVFISSALIPRNRITGSYGSSVFHFFRTYQAIFHSRCTIWQSQMMYECSSFSMSSPTILCLWLQHSGGCHVDLFKSERARAIGYYQWYYLADRWPPDLPPRESPWALLIQDFLVVSAGSLLVVWRKRRLWPCLHLMPEHLTWVLICKGPGGWMGRAVAYSSSVDPIAKTRLKIFLAGFYHNSNCLTFLWGKKSVLDPVRLKARKACGFHFHWWHFKIHCKSQAVKMIAFKKYFKKKSAVWWFAESTRFIHSRVTNSYPKCLFFPPHIKSQETKFQ